MKKKLYLSALILTAIVIHPVQAATVTFYTDRTSYESQLSSFSTIDFEGIVGDTEWTDYLPSMTDVAFSGTVLRVRGSHPVGGWSGYPFASAALANTYNGNITADLTTAGSGFTAAGGWFGSSYVDGTTTLTLYGTSGVLDTQTVLSGDLGLGEPEVFYGWIVEGDEITSVVHDLAEGWEGLDNFTYGYAVPEPATMVLLGLGGLLLRKRK